MKKRLLIGVAACLVLLLGGVGAAYAAGAFRVGTTAKTSAEPKAYGACVNVKTGYLRVLERNNLSKSVYGACKQDGSERYVSFPSSAGNLTTGQQQFIAGEGAPKATAGKIGQWYVDTKTGTLYGPKTSDGWGSGFALQGKDGEPGKSAYELWKESELSNGTDKSESAFWRWVRGSDKSLYRLWLEAKGYGRSTPQRLAEYREWLKAKPGQDGKDGVSPTKLTIEYNNSVAECEPKAEGSAEFVCKVTEENAGENGGEAVEGGGEG